MKIHQNSSIHLYQWKDKIIRGNIIYISTWITHMNEQNKISNFHFY